MISETIELIEDHLDDEQYQIFEYEHGCRIIETQNHRFYVGVQHGGDETLITVRENGTPQSGPNRLIGMPYTAVGDPDILDRVDRALDTLQYHNERYE